MPSESSSDDSSGSSFRRWGRRALWTLGGLVGTLAVLGGALLLLLQTETVATAAAQFLARQANPFPQTELTIERASGNWVRSLRLENVALTRTDSTDGHQPLAQIDTVTARYSLGALLQGRVHLRRVTLRSPSVTMRQAADSTWNWGPVLPTPSPDTSAGPPVRIDAFQLSDGTFRAAYYARTQDSTARIENLEVRARAVEVSPSLTGRLDTLGLRGHLPADTTALRLGAQGALSTTRVQLDTLHLTSPRSRVWGSGSARLPDGPSDTLADVGLTLRASPLVLGDVTSFAPTVDANPTESVTLDARLTGSAQNLTLEANAQFSEGGRLTVLASGTPRIEATPESPLQYEVEATIRNLTTSLLGPLDGAENTLSGDLQASLEGPQRSALDGSVDASLRDTHLYGVHTSALQLRSTVQDGRADLSVQGALNGTSLSVAGSARPFDEAPSMDLTTEVRDLSLDALAPDAGVDGTITATAQLRGRSMMTETAQYDVATTLGPSRLGTQSIESGTLSLVWRPQNAQFEGSLTLPEGVARAQGRAELDGSERFVLDTLAVENVNVAALIGDTTASRVSGSLHAEGRGFTPTTMQAQAELAVENARYGAHHVQSLHSTAQLDAGQMHTETTAQLNGSDWALTITGQPFADQPTAELTQGRFQALDVGPFLQDSTQSSALYGTIQGRVRGGSPSTMLLEAGLTLDSSRVNRQQISSASVDLSLRNGTLDTDLDLDTPEGQARLSVRAQPFEERPTYRLSQGSFENLNVGALMGVPTLTTGLTGALTLQAQGTTFAKLSLDSELTLKGSTINRAALSEGRLGVTANQGRVTADGTFSVTGGILSLRGHAERLAEVPSYTLRTTARSIDVGALAGFDSLRTEVDTLRWTLEGTGTSLDSLGVTTHLTARSVRIDRFRLDSLRLAGQVEQGLLSVDTLSVHSNAIEGHGQGPLALTQGAGTSSFDLQASITDVTPLDRFLGAELLRLREGTIDAHVYGAAGEQQFDGTATLDGLIYNEIRAGSVQLSYNGQRGTSHPLDRLEVEGTAGFVSFPGLTTTRTRLDVHYDGTTVNLSTDVQLDPRRSVRLGATFQPEASPMDIHLNQFNLRLGPDRWSLLHETTLTINDHYRIDQLELQSGDQQILADGVIDPSGTQNLSVTIEGLRLGGIAPLLGWTGLDGILSGSFSMNGAATAPTIDGQLALNLRSEGSAVGTLDLNVGYEDLTTTLDAQLTHTNGSTLTATGSVPMDLRLRTPTSVDVSSRPVQLDASTQQFPINWIGPFLDPETFQSVSGTLVGDISIRGALDQPELSGTVSVTDAGAYFLPLETTYRNGSIALQLTDDQITLENAVIHSANGGSLRASGGIDFPELTVGEYNLSLQASDLLAIDTRAYRRAIIDGNVTLRGTTRRPAIAGNVQVEGGSVYYAEALAETAMATSEVTLSLEDQLALEERFGLRLSAADTTTFDFYEASSLDLSVQIQRDTWLRSNSNPEMNVQFSGNLDVQKAHLEDPRIFGTISVVEGQSTIQQFGQQFQITNGTLTFNGDPYAPSLNLTAVYQQRARGTQGTEVRITLTLSGRPDNLTPSLTSDPSMSTRNILSYLATGRPAEDLFGGGTEGGNLATQVALGQASNYVENLAASELGFDVVRLDVQTEGVSYLTVGRYLTPRFFIAIEQPVMSSTSQSAVPPTAFIPDVTLEYQLTDYLLLRSLSGQQSFELNLLFEYAY